MTTPDPCNWYYDQPLWESTCGFSFEFTDDGPAANGFLFCPKCGRTLREVLEEEDEESADPLDEVAPARPVDTPKIKQNCTSVSAAEARDVQAALRARFADGTVATPQDLPFPRHAPIDDLDVEAACDRQPLPAPQEPRVMSCHACGGSGRANPGPYCTICCGRGILR